MNLLLFVPLLLGYHCLHAHAENNIVIVKDKDNSSTPVLFANVDAELAPNHPFDEYDEIQIRSKQNKRKKKKKSKKRSKKEGKGSNDEKVSNDNSGQATDAPTHHQTPFPTPLPTSEPTDPPQTPTYEPTHNPTPPPTSPPTTIAPSKQPTTRPTDMPAPSKSATAEPTSKACSNTEDFNMCLAIDMSGSVCNGFSNSLCTDCSPVDTCNTGGQNLSRCCSNFDNIIKFTQSLVSLLGELPVDQAFSVVHFGTYVNIASTSESARQTVKSLNKLEYSGGKTNMVGALDSCQTSFSAPPTGRKNFILLITDGAPSVPDINAPMVTELAATGIKEQGTFIIPILIEEAANQFIPEVAFLRDRISSGKVFVAEFDGLADIQNTVVDQVCESPPLPTKKPTLSPTFSPSNDPMAPAGSIYYMGFEQGIFPDPPKWTTANEDNPDLVWGLTTQKARSGVYSLKSPNLESEGGSSAVSSKATFTTDADWPAGQLIFSFLASIGMPLDYVQIVVDNEIRSSQFELMTEFEERTLQLSPGQHTIDFVYTYNPLNIPEYNLPPTTAFPDRLGAAFIDDVYFVPEGTPPAAGPTTPAAGPTTIVPTSTPDGASYYRGFEDPDWPQQYPEWATSNDGNPDLVWDMTSEESNSGVYSMRSPVLETEERTQASSRLTLTTEDDSSGAFHYSVLAGTDMPFDQIQIYIDGNLRGSESSMTAFEERMIPLSPGPHTIEFVYTFNPNNIPAQGMPPIEMFPDRIGAVYIDDVYFVPLG